MRFATIFDDISDRKRAEQEIQRLAFFDHLTGLPNRTLLRDRLGEALMISARDDHGVAVLFLDLDRFKPINDSMGHAAGDGLLRAVGNRLLSCIRESDTVGRLGGDEFVVILPMIKQGLDAVRVARNLMEQVSEPFAFDDREIYTSCSIGIALSPVDGNEADTLIRSADMAMYAAKERGRNNFQFYSADMNRRASERHEIETRLRRALREQEIQVCYQPQLDIGRGRVTGVEALVRWRDPELGVISPLRFIPLAEETGLILPLGEMVLSTACAQVKAWQEAGASLLSVAVNLSGFQFKQGDIAETVHRVLVETGLSPNSLELELTESMLMDHAKATVETLHELKAMGLRLTIDDFGTGYSSLHYLKNFPIDRIKIAQEFIRDLAADPGDAAIVETIIAMTTSLGIEVMAEGVETIEQLRFLRSRGCVQMQGFYFAKPMSGETISQHLSSGIFREGLCPLGLS
jgi:diguanylate cyclase (GGDEF)-like protein